MKKILLPFAFLIFSLPSLLLCQPVFYGLTQSGGQNLGSIIKYESSTNGLTSVFDFPNDPKYPSQFGGLVQASNGKFYGMTSQGGSSGFGTIFSFDPSTNIQVKLFDFNKTSGGYPN